MSEEKNDESRATASRVDLLVRLRDAIKRAVDQMDYCDKDGRPQSLCPCCFQKVRDILIGELNETTI